MFAMLLVSPMPRAQAGERPQVMVVGLAHFVHKLDLHNATWGSSSLSPDMQTQIARIVNSLAKFKPTKVMIEARANDLDYVQRYLEYRQGKHRLGANEREQFGYRLAGSRGLSTIYPIDSVGNFPFDYDSVQAAAAKDGQNAILMQANVEQETVIRKENRLERADDVIGALRYLNARGTLKANNGWYLYVDLIGAGSSDAGESLTSNWYARNLRIFANIVRALRPGDRVVVFIGAGHASILRPLIDRAPFLTDVDPEGYLPVR
jgi:hypothetical protein